VVTDPHRSPESRPNHAYFSGGFASPAGNGCGATETI
jgi:hypothetical protein